MNNKALFKLIGLVILGLLCVTIKNACRSKPQIVGYDYITGTSLWDLARDCPNDMEKRDYIAEIVALNAVSGNVVYADRLYQVPLYKR